MRVYASAAARGTGRSVLGGGQAGRRAGRGGRQVTVVGHGVRGVGRVAGRVGRGRLPGGLAAAVAAGRLRWTVHVRRAGRGRGFGAGHAGQVDGQQARDAGLLQELLDQEAEHQHDGHLAEYQRLGGLHADQRHHDRREHLHLHLHHHHERHEHLVLHHAHLHVRYKRYKRNVELGLFELG